MSFRTAYWLTFLILTLPLLLTASNVPLTDPGERVRAFTRAIEFDYVSWTVDAFGVKLGQLALGTANYLPLEERSSTVLESLDLVRQINQLEAQLNDIYADPNVADPQAAAADMLKQLEVLRERRALLEPLAEAILQDQVNHIASSSALSLGGQAFPPVLYHTTPPPDALIISPREVIRQDYSVSISPEITVDEIEALEARVDSSLNVSSLVVGVGGIGLYPTMVMETTDINGLAIVVAHEWVHNFLSLRPLGISLLSSPELRTMNETVASIAGRELGRAVVATYYPEYLPPEEPPAPPENQDSQSQEPPAFDFRAEMHETRVTTDRLLAEGRIEEAETYMELRRQYLWDHGYHIRKLNQAYFAFYGAYADQPGGEAGEDPVGEAVRSLRENSKSLANFINRISWMWSFEQLQRAVENR